MGGSCGIGGCCTLYTGGGVGLMTFACPCLGGGCSTLAWTTCGGFLMEACLVCGGLGFGEASCVIEAAGGI